MLHLDVVDGQVVIQCNNTDQDIAQELMAAGIAADAIVYPQLAVSPQREESVAVPA